MSLLSFNKYNNFFLVTALGNPGKDYSFTRHNIGFIFADFISTFYNFGPYTFYRKINGLIATGKIANKGVLILKPQTFMNNSGTAVKLAMAKFKIKIDNLIVVHDDADIKFASQQIKYGGSSAGHNGIKSIVSELGTQDFIRIRLGIGKPTSETNLSDFVLATFLDEEMELIETSCRPVWSELISKILTDGAQKAMNFFNHRKS